MKESPFSNITLSLTGAVRVIASKAKQSFCFLILLIFTVNTFGFLPSAQAEELYLPKPGVRVSLSPDYNPPVLKGITVHPENPFKFDFILDQGDRVIASEATQGTKRLPNEIQLKEESKKLIKYFLASITTPDKDLWVNLSPYEKNRIIPESFGQTDMGRDLLAQDYLLKQITASLMYPEDEIGKRFWKRVYDEAAKKFGTTNIPINTFNKVWIVPEHAKVYEHGNTAFVVNSRLKVMLESDYLAEEKNSRQPGDIDSLGAFKHQLSQCPQAGCQASNPMDVKATQGNPASHNQNSLIELSKNIIKEIIIPELEKEVNTGKNFAPLRQVYQSLILAVWFKKRLKDSILGRKYMDKNKVTGIDIDDKDSSQTIYEQYLKAFKKGVYNYIKEEQDFATGQTIPRKYFAGGVVWVFRAPEDFDITSQITIDEAQIADPALVSVLFSNYEADKFIEKNFQSYDSDRSISGWKFTVSDQAMVSFADLIKLFNHALANQGGVIDFIREYYQQGKALQDWHGAISMTKLFKKIKYTEVSSELIIDSLIKLKNVISNFDDYLLTFEKIINTDKDLIEVVEILVVMAKAVGIETRYLFEYGLPAVKGIIKTPEDLRRIGNDIVEMAEAAGGRAWSLFVYGLPEVKRIFQTDEEFEKHWDDLVEMAKVAGDNTVGLFSYGLPAVKGIIKTPEDLRRIGNDIVEMAKAAGDSAWNLFEHGFPALKGIFKTDEKFEKHWGDLVEMAKAAGDSALSLFRDGLPAVKGIFKTDEEFEKHWGDLVEMAKAAGDNAVGLFSYGLPAVKGIFKTEEEFQQYRVLIMRLLESLNKHNSKVVLELLQASEILLYVASRNGDWLKHMEFYVQVFEENPRLGLQIWEGLFNAIRSGQVNIDLDQEVQTKVRSFIKGTNGFNETLFAYYNRFGEERIVSLQARARMIANDQVDIYMLNQWEGEYTGQGFNGFQMNLGIIQMAIVLSGASFVKKQEIEGLWRKYIELGDKRGDIPQQLKDAQGSGALTLAQKSIDDVQFVLKQGQLADPDNKVSNLYTQYSWPDQGKSKEAIDREVEEDGRKFKEVLRDYLLNRGDVVKQQAVFDAFSRWASHNDLLKEKIDAVSRASGDYELLQLLDTLLKDKDQLTQLFREFLESNDEFIDLLRKQANEGLANETGKVKAINGILRSAKSINDKLVAIGRQVSRLSPEGFEQLLSNFQGEEKTVLINARGMSNEGVVDYYGVIEEVFSQPRASVQKEIGKYETRKVGELKLSVKAVKGIGHSLWGLCAGVCIATDVKLFEKKEFYLLAIIDENSQQTLGYVHLFETVNKQGKKVVTVPGINPSVELLSRVKARDVYDLIEESLLKVQELAGYEGVYIPIENNILSNRSDIQKIVSDKNYDRGDDDIDSVNWNLLPEPYPFQEVYKVSKKDAQVRKFADSAMTVMSQSWNNPKFVQMREVPQQKKVGGIDLTADRMDLEIESDNVQIGNPLDLKSLENIDITGLYIKDIEIKPITNLPQLLGISSN